MLFSKNEDSLKGIYGWWIQMPVNLSYSSAEKGSTLPLVIQVLVVRVSTQNNLSGVAIENMKITKGSGDQVITSV